MGLNENDSTSETVGRRLGRLPKKTTLRALQFATFFRDFSKYVNIPKTQTYWAKKPPIPLRSYGNLRLGCCTIAKQAVASTRFERIESRGRKTINIPDSEVIRRYTSLSDRLYGGGDNGAYEDDALNDWRNPETAFRDTDGNPHTIDAYLRVDAANHEEVRAAMALAKAKGLAICLNLPAAFAAINPPAIWDVPEGQPLIGPYLGGSWGGHSLWAPGMTLGGLVEDHTWDMEQNIVAWRAVAAYCDEVHLVIDSVDVWRKAATARKVKSALGDVADAVNALSSIKVEL